MDSGFIPIDPNYNDAQRLAAYVFDPALGSAITFGTSYGSHAEQARQEGAGYGQQQAFGLGSAALDTGTNAITVPTMLKSALPMKELIGQLAKGEFKVKAGRPIDADTLMGHLADDARTMPRAANLQKDIQTGTNELYDYVTQNADGMEQGATGARKETGAEAGNPLDKGEPKGYAGGVGKTLVDNPFDDAGNLKVSVKYQSGEFNYNYETDFLGRLEVFQTDDLRLTERTDRLSHNPNTPGKLPSDHAGHLAGDKFGGSPYLDNLVSQSPDINLSQYKKIENQWSKAIEEGKQVQTQVKVKYLGNSSRPSKFIIDYSIDGEYFSQTLVN